MTASLPLAALLAAAALTIATLASVSAAPTQFSATAVGGAAVSRSDAQFDAGCDTPSVSGISGRAKCHVTLPFFGVPLVLSVQRTDIPVAGGPGSLGPDVESHYALLSVGDGGGATTLTSWASDLSARTGVFAGSYHVTADLKHVVFVIGGKRDTDGGKLAVATLGDGGAATVARDFSSIGAADTALFDNEYDTYIFVEAPPAPGAAADAGVNVVVQKVPFGGGGGGGFGFEQPPPLPPATVLTGVGSATPRLAALPGSENLLPYGMAGTRWMLLFEPPAHACGAGASCRDRVFKYDTHAPDAVAAGAVVPLGSLAGAPTSLVLFDNTARAIYVAVRGRSGGELHSATYDAIDAAGVNESPFRALCTGCLDTATPRDQLSRSPFADGQLLYAARVQRYIVAWDTDVTFPATFNSFDPSNPDGPPAQHQEIVANVLRTLDTSAASPTPQLLYNFGADAGEFLFSSSAFTIVDSKYLVMTLKLDTPLREHYSLWEVDVATRQAKRVLPAAATARALPLALPVYSPRQRAIVWTEQGIKSAPPMMMRRKRSAPNAAAAAAAAAAVAVAASADAVLRNVQHGRWRTDAHVPRAAALNDARDAAQHAAALAVLRGDRGMAAPHESRKRLHDTPLPNIDVVAYSIAHPANERVKVGSYCNGDCDLFDTFIAPLVVDWRSDLPHFITPAQSGSGDAFTLSRVTSSDQLGPPTPTPPPGSVVAMPPPPSVTPPPSATPTNVGATPRPPSGGPAATPPPSPGTPPTSGPPPTPDTGGPNLGVIIGAVVGVVVCLLCICVIVALVVCMGRRGGGGGGGGGGGAAGGGGGRSSYGGGGYGNEMGARRSSRRSAYGQHRGSGRARASSRGARRSNRTGAAPGVTSQYGATPKAPYSSTAGASPQYGSTAGASPQYGSTQQSYGSPSPQYGSTGAAAAAQYGSSSYGQIPQSSFRNESNQSAQYLRR